jgi:hypothetical protein
MGCFGTRLHTESTWRFGTSPHAQNSEITYIQHYRFGAVIAHHRPGGSGELPTSRPCVKSRLASPVNLWIVRCCHFIAVTGRFTVGVTQLKVKKEEGAGEVMWTNLNEDAAAFRRILPLGFAVKSRPPLRLIFSQNRPGQLASFPHPAPPCLRLL